MLSRYRRISSSVSPVKRSFGSNPAKRSNLSEPLSSRLPRSTSKDLRCSSRRLAKHFKGALCGSDASSLGLDADVDRCQQGLEQPAEQSMPAGAGEG
jgi:hypothetical protein